MPTPIYTIWYLDTLGMPTKTEVGIKVCII